MNLIPVHQNYADYEPQFDFSTIVTRLLSDVSPNYLGSLSAVVLSSSSRLNQNRSHIPRKGRKLPARHLCGLYHHPTKKQLAWIELYVDNLFPSKMPSWLMRFRFVQEFFVGRTLFHEIGHHIDFIAAREQKREAAAEKWRKKLLRQYIRKHYWYLKPIMAALYYFFKAVRWFQTPTKMRF